MSLNAVYQTIGQVIPTQQQIERCYGFISNVALNLNKVAVPTIALLALSSATGAEAGPACYATCVSACFALANPFLTPACITGCLALAGPWCP